MSRLATRGLETEAIYEGHQQQPRAVNETTGDPDLPNLNFK
jgi:hypothetical protein